MIREPLTRLALAGAVVLSLSPVLPALGADGSGASGWGDATQCKEGLTYNEQTKKCEQTGLLDDRQLYEQGRALALAGFYENALEALMAVRDKEDARVLTYIGYAKRKMGAVDEGIAWYHKALAIDPGNLSTHEYLGEGYVAAGRLDLARMELAKLGTLCGTGCEQYAGLAAAIAGAPESWGGR